MNTVCPGFMPHHVKPNRCRRCFRDIHDHESNKDVSTSFTISLPRRRRESVAIAEAAEESRNERTTSINLSVFETSSLGRRTRQRSASTSSWFQEKKENEIQKEKIDSLFKHAEDSNAVSSREINNEPAEESKSVRNRFGTEENKTEQSRTRFGAKENSSDKSESFERNRETVNSDTTTRTRERDTLKSVSPKPLNKTESSAESKVGLTSSSVKDFKARKSPEPAPKFVPTKPWEVKLKSTKPSKTDSNEVPPKIPQKTLDSKNLVSVSDATKAKSTETSTADSKLIDKKPVTSRFLDSRWQKPVETKPAVEKPAERPKTEVRRDSKVSLFAAKFEVPSAKEEKSIDSKTSDVKPKDTSAKRVLDRFPSFKKEEPKPVQIKPVVKPKEPSSSSSSEEESSSSEEESKESSPSPPPPPIKPVPKIIPKILERTASKESEASSPEVAFVVKLKTPVASSEPQENKVKEQEKAIQQKQSEIGELQKTIENLKKDLKKSEENCTKLEREKSDIQKRRQHLLDKDKEALEKTASELTKMRSKLSEMQTSQDKVKDDNIKLKLDMEKSKKELDRSKQEMEKYKQDMEKSKLELSTSKRELDRSKNELDKSKRESKQELEKSKQELDKSKTELSEIKQELERSKQEAKRSKEPSENKLVNDMQTDQEQLREENRKLKQELEKSKKEVDKFKIEVDKTKRELDKSKTEVDKSKRDLDRSKSEVERNKRDLDKSKQDLEKAKQELEKAKQETKNRESLQQDPKSKQTVDQLKLKLQQTETLCQELMEENEDIKKEVRDLEQELEELHDNFREDQASEFRGLKKELETATKNCRVLQFKLRKAEKRCDQLEMDRHSLEDKVREFQANSRLDADKGRTKELENEIKMSRKLTATLNEEIDGLKDTIDRLQVENDSLRQQKSGVRSITPTKQSRLSPVASREGRCTPSGKDIESLSRELYDTMERENDLREQLKFSEEEAKTARRKMSSLEQENETLMMQMKKLNTLLRARKDQGKGSNRKGFDDEEEEELSADNLKLQLEMQEQEMTVLRRKVEDTEKENESLQGEVKYLQEKLINQPLIQMPDLPEEVPPSGLSAGSAYWEKKARLLEHELRETRKKTMEKEREIERLHTEVEIYRKKASRMMVRSRSLDSDLQVDLKRQLQLVEQEATMLRQKVSSLEAENDKLGTENKRFQLRLSKKPPMSSAELAQLDNLELQQKNEDLQRKIEDLKQELIEKTEKNDNPVAVLQDYRPRRESLSSVPDSEADLIASLKKKLKTQEEEQQTLQNKCMHLEIDHNRLSREFRRLKETLASKKKPMKAIRDSATRIELRELVDELQDEISELQVSLRGREVVQEGLEEELEKTKKSLKEALENTKKKEDQLKEVLRKGEREKQAIQKEADAQKKRATNAEEQLNQVSGQLGSDQLELAKKARSLQEELHESERKVKAAEEALEKKTRRLRETQEKLNDVNSLKDDLMRTNRLLASQKEDLAKELEDHRELLVKAEARITDLRDQMDNTDRDVTSLRKECNQLRNELEDERSRLKQMKPAAGSIESSQYSLLTKEREDLRRANNELRNKIESLQQEIFHNEQIYIEKESRLREDHKRKKEAAVREAREKGEAAIELAKEEEKILRNKFQEISDKLEKAEIAVKESQEKSRQVSTQHRRERDSWVSSREDLESRLRSETKKRERAERDVEQASKLKEEELLQSKERLVQLEREQRRLLMQVQETESSKQKATILEGELDKIRKKYDDITAKYDQLEEEFVRTKSRLVQEKEQAEAEIQCLKRDTNNLTADLSMIKETSKTKQDTWVKEKHDLQDKLKDLERRGERLRNVEQERARLKSQLDEKETLVESYRKEEKHLKEEREKLRRSVDEMSKASEAQRQVFVSSLGSDSGRAATKELVSLKAEYEGRMAIMVSEISSMQQQIANLASERDAFKSRLTSAERSAEEMKTGSLKRERARHREEADVARRKVKELRTQLEEVKEQMEDTLLENRNLRLQIETDRNSYDIQLSELKSKINQLEEQKILESTRGQTRNLAKTRLELAWEKERHELQSLLTDSQKMIADLRSRLESAEKNKDKDRQGLRSELNQMKESAEKEHLENRRKMSELHSSLLDMRESQAKLRGLYDRMKREREILFTEREGWKQRLHLAYEIHTKIQELHNDVELVSSTVTDDKAQKQITVTPEFKEAMVKVKERFLELQKAATTFKDDDKFKRPTTVRRAISAQEVNHPVSQDPSQRWNQPQRITNYPVPPPSMILRPPPRQKALHRKSLSLDHTLAGRSAADALKIWESEGESAVSTPAGSLLSLRMGHGYDSDSSFGDSEYKYGGSLQEHRMPRRYLQTPSGMTTDSERGQSSREGSIATSCESVPVTVQTQQKKATLRDKLKLLRRAKSIDVSKPSADGGTVSKEAKENSLRSKISKVLKKPLGRSVSMDVHRQKTGPILPPKGVQPDSVPKRPTAEKPLSASRGELSTERPLRKSTPQTTTLSRTGRETPV